MRRLNRHPLMERIVEKNSSLNPKGRIISAYILENPKKVVFMTIKQLSSACQVSESTVVRFVGQLGYEGYSEFLQALRDLVDTEMTVLDRIDLSEMEEPKLDRFRRLVFEEIDNLKQLYDTMNREDMDKMVDYLHKSSTICVIGSRLSDILAHYMGWSLTKVHPNVHILKGSDSTTLDWLTMAPADNLVVIIATSRYTNELIRVGKWVRRLGQTLLVIAESSVCPLIQFAHLTLVAPFQHIPVLGSPSTLFCLINYLILELANRRGNQLKEHQEKLELSYRENDVLFNPDIEACNKSGIGNGHRSHSLPTELLDQQKARYILPTPVGT